VLGPGLGTRTFLTLALRKWVFGFLMCRVARLLVEFCGALVISANDEKAAVGQKCGRVT
jgi:hypothetical protein